MLSKTYTIAFLVFCGALAGCDRWISVSTVVAEKNVVEWPSLYAKAVNQLKKQDCRGAWDTLWPAAKKGDKNAIYLLSEMLFEGVEININSNFKKDAFIFFVYSLDHDSHYSIYTKNPTNAEVMQKFSKVELQELSPINQCLSTESGAYCKNKAIISGVIPTYEYYIKSIDKIINKNKSISGCHIDIE